MPNIYGGSIITIAAARSDTAKKGFLMDRNNNLSKQAFKLRYICENGDYGDISLIDVGLSPEPLDQRAWALQERLLPRRTVEFGMYQTRWLCQQSQTQVDGWRCSIQYFTVRNDNMGLNDPVIAGTHPRYSELDKKRFTELISRWSGLVKT